jgi:hypothetical protein
MPMSHKASAEPFGPHERLEFSRRAEAPGADQARFLDQFATDILPLPEPNDGLADFAPLSVSRYAR